jgi:hypothetical protein
VPAGSYSTSFFRGDTFERSFTLNASGTPVNLTGYTFEMVLRAEFGATSYDFTPYITIPTPSNGTAVLKVPKAVTAGVLKGRYRYFLRYTDNAGEATTMLEGTIDVNVGVSS